MTFGPRGRDHESKNKLCMFIFEPTKLVTYVLEKRVMLEKNWFGKSTNLGRRHFHFWWNIWEPRNPEDPFNIVLKILTMGSVS